MPLLPIVIAPDRRLKLVCKPVERVDAAVRQLMDDLLATMYAAPGIGLAAPQVGARRRVIVVDVAGKDEAPSPLRLANPVILAHSSELVVMSEGCLSLPEIYLEIERPASVRVRYLDRDDKSQEIAAGGLLSRCLQHEIDHLDGILSVDHVSALKRNMILRKLAKQRKIAAEDASE